MVDTATLAARTALAEHSWREAYELFSELGARDELEAADLERLGEAAWWSAHPAESIDAFERAYAAYVTNGDHERASLLAVRLALEHADRGEMALWNGWLRRAIREMPSDADCVERGFLEVALIRDSMDRGAVEEAIGHADAAYEIGGRFGNRDLECLGQVLRGGVLVVAGNVTEGMRLVDEGTLAAVNGELSPFVAGNLYCITLGICRSLADYRRAREWTDAAARWCQREAITGFPGICRVQRAELMRFRGALSDAEQEARAAVRELTAFGRPIEAGAGAYEVGEVRFRLGDLDGAEAAFAEAHRLGHEPQPGIALLHLARTRIDAARSSIGTALADAQEAAERARLLPARVEIALASHDLTDARAAAEELDGIASSLDSPIVRASAREALGIVLTHEVDDAGAIRELRAAVRAWTEADAPFETARARRHLAMAYRLKGDEDSAMLELRTAGEAFDDLGARLEGERCEELLRAGAGREAGRRVVRTFIFTDIVGSTNLIETIGDAAWENVLRWHDETLRALIASHGGEIVHPTGDGFFAAFPDAGAAVSCAVETQRRLRDHRQRNGFAPEVRIGLHTAEATVVAEDYAGIGVHEAARVGALAEGSEILATVDALVGADLPFALTNERDVQLKGIAHPVRVVTIDWRA
jgi:class 3 adenylate cyclase